LLPPDTERIWSYLKEQAGLAGFILVGGSALALRISHRLSEDLDFAWIESRLPLARLEAICGVPQRDDEGYAHLLPNPPNLAEMTAFFTEQRNQLEVELAADALRRQQPLGGQDRCDAGK
jgi:hypothetical protein